MRSAEKILCFGILFQLTMSLTVNEPRLKMGLDLGNKQLSRRNWLKFEISASTILGGALQAQAKDPRSSKGLSGLEDAKPGTVDRTAFDGVVERVRAALEAVGVEKQPEFKPTVTGPPIPRDYPVGRRPGSDRLLRCPDGMQNICASSSQDEVAAKAVAPFVYLTQKGDALGGLLEMINDDPRYTLLATSGNFFNGGGVYVLAEMNANDGVILDCEFNFLPGVLENLVGMRVIERERSGDMFANLRGVLAPTDIVKEVGQKLRWIPLSEGKKTKWATEDDEETFLSAEIEWNIRGKYEKEVEDTELALAYRQAEEEARVESLKAEINKLLDQIQAQNNQREREQRELLARVDTAREEYYNGVLKRQGSYKNTGRYSSVSRLSAGSSIGININKQDEDITSKVLSNQNLN